MITAERYRSGMSRWRPLLRAVAISVAATTLAFLIVLGLLRWVVEAPEAPGEELALAPATEVTLALPLSETEAADRPATEMASGGDGAPAGSEDAHPAPSSVPATGRNAATEDQGAPPEHGAEGSHPSEDETEVAPPAGSSGGAVADEAQADGAATDETATAMVEPHGPPRPMAPQPLGEAGLAPPPVARSGLSGVVVSPVASSAYARLPPAERDGVTLATAPDPHLIERVGGLNLPKVAADGRRPWRAYGRPFANPQGLIPIAMIVMRLGLSDVATDAAVERLPGGVTLAFDSYGRNLDEAVDRARRAGHEVLVSVATESTQFPFEDPGPMALSSSLTPDQNLKRLQTALGAFPGYVGVLLAGTTAFADRYGPAKAMLTALDRRGLMLVDGTRGEGRRLADLARAIPMPVVRVDLQVDLDPQPAAIAAELTELEARAREAGAAVGLAQPYPVTFAQLVAWIATLPSRGFILAPVSALPSLEHQP